MNNKLNKALMFGLLLLCSLLFNACKKDDDKIIDKEPEVEGPVGTGDPTEIGVPSGAGVTATIGKDGGTIQSEDKAFSLVIPAGALSESTEITIQPITNKSPNGVAKAYRVVTGKEIASSTIKLKLGEKEFATMAGPKLAYQDLNNKTWIAKSGAQIDETNRTVSITMGKFNVKRDFSVIASVEMNLVISPTDNHIVPLQPIKIQVWGVETLMKNNYPEDTWLAVGGLKPLKLEEDGIIAWFANDIEGGDEEVGSISDAAHSDPAYSGMYQAPLYLPSENPVSLAVNVKLGTKTVRLSESVKIIQDNYIKSALGANSAQATANTSPNSLHISMIDFLDENDPSKYAQGLIVNVNRGFTGAEGSYNFSFNEDVEGAFFDNVNRKEIGRTYWFDEEGNKHFSTGEVKIHSFKKSETNEGFAVIEGTITGTAYFLIPGTVEYESEPFTASFKCVSNS